jgi:septal ring factor EnvC (AmiA/AmiB activator)
MEIDSLFAAETYAAGQGPEGHRPRQAGYVVTIMVLVLVVAGLAVASVLSAQETEKWQATADRRTAALQAVTDERDTLRRQLLESQAAVASAQESLAATTEQLDAANGQVKALTVEKAAMLDKASFMPAALAMSTELAQSVSACVMAVQPLPAEGVSPGVPAGPEPVALVAPAVGADDPCDRARADSEAFTKWLGSQ